MYSFVVPSQPSSGCARLYVLQGEGLRAGVNLADGGGGALHGQVRGGDGVDAGGVALGGDGRRHSECQLLAGAGDREGLGRHLTLALPLTELGQLAVNTTDDHGFAVLGLGLHGAGLEDAELVASGGMSESRSRARRRVTGYLQALDAVLDAGGAEVGDLVDGGALAHGGGGGAGGKEGGCRELHLERVGVGIRINWVGCNN